MCAQVPDPEFIDGGSARFRPAWWLLGPHGQTLGARFTRSARGVRLVRERLATPDDDFLDLDWAATDPAQNVAAGGPLVVVLHGLEGSAGSGYALETYRALARVGLGAVGLNFRSCGGTLNRAARLYHSGETDDLRYVVRLLAGRHPGRPLGAIGFSLGGNVLLKYLGEEARRGSVTPLAAAAAVSVPYDLAAGARHMERGFARIYVRRLLRSLKAKLRVKADVVGDRVDLPRALAATTFHEFDDAATAPLHGFAGADDYYARSSSGPFVQDVAVPTRLIHADDDPFLPGTAVPREAARANPRIDACFTAVGGHVGFVQGSPWARRYWAEARASEFVARHLGGGRGESSAPT